MRFRGDANLVLMLGLAGLVAGALGCAVSDSGGFVEPVPPTRQPHPDDELGVRARDVRLDLGALSDDPKQPLVVPLFDGEVVNLLFVAREEFGERAFVWSGRSEGPFATTGAFSVNGGTLVGQVRTFDGRLFRFLPLDGKLHRLLEIDPKVLQRDCASTERDVVHGRDERDVDTCATDPPGEIDLMVLYTDDARAGAGDAATIEATIHLAVAEANQTYANSDVDQRLRLVHTSEISYAESGSSATDLNRLEATSDNHLDDAHTLRDAHAADVVILITETIENGIAGRARIMGTVANAFEASAFGIVVRANATGNFTFAHELGHIMGARHDWAGDPNNNSPYEYNHGHHVPNPSNNAVPAWRTIMARNGLGGTRLANWSNPNIDFPIGAATTDPMGNASGSQQTDNHRTLNNTAPTVANFRCSSPGADSVWMRDTWDDTGAEPDPATAGQAMWRSPYIWVRNAADSNLLNEHVHENPLFGQTNFVYAKLHNGFGVTTSGELEFHVADASTSLIWPTGWTLVGSVPVTNFAAHTTRIVEQSWSPPGKGHYCMLARWVSSSDPMASPEGTDINVNVRANNNLVWRNLNVVDLGSDETTDAFFLAGNPDRREELDATLLISSPRGETSFLLTGRVILELDDLLLKAWIDGGERGSGFEREGNAILVTGERASLEHMRLPPGATGRVRIIFQKLPSTPKTEFEVDVSQYAHGKVLIGGVSYVVDTTVGSH